MRNDPGSIPRGKAAIGCKDRRTGSSKPGQAGPLKQTKTQRQRIHRKQKDNRRQVHAMMVFRRNCGAPSMMSIHAKARAAPIGTSITLPPMEQTPRPQIIAAHRRHAATDSEHIPDKQRIKTTCDQRRPRSGEHRKSRLPPDRS